MGQTVATITPKVALRAVSVSTMSLSSLTIPNLFNIPKYTIVKSHRKAGYGNGSFIAKLDPLQNFVCIQPIILLAIKVFFFSILYHLVEEKTSTLIDGFSFSWFITFFELFCAFLLEFIELLSISIYTDNMGLNSNIDIENGLNSNSHSNNNSNNSNCGIINWFICNKFRWEYLFLGLILVLQRGLSTLVIATKQLDYATYQICRNSKMLFVMLLSILWLKKKYKFIDYILVILITLSVIVFKIAGSIHDDNGSLNISQIYNNIFDNYGFIVILFSSFLAALDNAWKERIFKSQHNTNILNDVNNNKISEPNEVLFYINLIGVSMLFILTIVNGELQKAVIFLFFEPSTIFWMILRGLSYSLWIHYSVVLIQKSGALLNQYISAFRKLFSVILSFIIFLKPWNYIHSVGFLLFTLASILKVLKVSAFNNYNNKHNNNISNNNNNNENEYLLLNYKLSSGETSDASINNDNERRALISHTNNKKIMNV